MGKNLCGKTRKVNDPYEVWIMEDAAGGKWEWRVLKKYQSPENEAKNQYARWFVACKSPFTHGGYDMGDSYVREITNYARQVNLNEYELETWKEY